MTKFLDREGEEWNIHVDLPLARELARLTGWDILSHKSYQELMESWGARLEVLWFLVRSQGPDKGVETFGEFEARLHSGKGLVFKASDAMVEAFISFYRRLDLAPMVTVAETYLEMSQVMLEATLADSFGEELERNKNDLYQTLGVPEAVRIRRRKKRKRKDKRSGKT